ncbi:hypothetical protein MAR_013794 [Mya arenaria]|uniref:SGNH hydrolase-type esterase domain-containing protein n=1 Tax=Mya arenaria TaxID=6604 RepID=A0ABY7G0V9_MYAAR|nr:hypothetical protein MAR_013794 [Mya arenaria]
MWFTAESPRPYTKVAQISDLSLSECKCTLLIRCSKTDQYSNSESLMFTHSSDNTICPLYLSVRPNIDGPLFCRFRKEPLTKYQFRAMLMKCLEFCGIRAIIKSHSFRIGATALASMLNIPDDDIKLMGRWSSRGSTNRRANCVDSALVNYQTGRGVIWAGVPGLRYSQVLNIANSLRQCTPTPNLHFGGNDLGSENCGLLRKNMKQVILALLQLFPYTNIVYTCILSRLNWRNSFNDKIMEKSRDRVNRELIHYVIQHGHKAITHSDFNDKLPGLFLPDGVHLSPGGKDIFLSTLQSALELF